MMLPFLLEEPVYSTLGLIGKWENTLKALCDLASVHRGVAYVTIDEAVLQRGETHRRPGLHVDGVGENGEYGSWGGGGKYAANGMIVAASVRGCTAYRQDFDDAPGQNGDCEHLRWQLGEDAVFMKANIAYWCNPLCVHEGIGMEEQTFRQWIRLSLPSDAPWYEGYTVNPNVKPTGEIRKRRSAFMAYRP